jgi:hypothetical protein
MSTTTRAEASRINGRKSHGPTTPEGKAKSSANSLKHGLYSTKPFPETAAEKEFLSRLRQEFMDHFKPVGSIETLLVENIVGCHARIRQNWRIEEIVVAGAPSPDEDPTAYYNGLVNNMVKFARVEKSVLASLREMTEQLNQFQLVSRMKSRSPNAEAVSARVEPSTPKEEKFRNEPKNPPSTPAHNRPKPQIAEPKPYLSPKLQKKLKTRPTFSAPTLAASAS